MPSVSWRVEGSGPHPAGPTITSGHGPGSDGRTRRNARTRRSTFLRGSSVPTVRRNSPDTPTWASSASVAIGSGSGRWSAPPGTTVIRASSTPEVATSAATSRDGTTMCAPRSRTRASAASCHRRPRGVVASGCRRQATSWTVTTSRLRLDRRRVGAASDTECTMSKPSGAWRRPWSQARVRSGPGSREVVTRQAEGRQRVVRAARSGGRSPAGQEREVDRVALRARAASPPSSPRA